jgi:hypothetical protein
VLPAADFAQYTLMAAHRPASSAFAVSIALTNAGILEDRAQLTQGYIDFFDCNDLIISLEQILRQVQLREHAGEHAGSAPLLADNKEIAMTTHKSARAVIAFATLLTVITSDAPLAFAARQGDLPIVTHLVRSDARIHAAVRTTAPVTAASALAPAPSSQPGGVCDVGDNPMIC